MTKQRPKRVSASTIEMTELVLPNDTNVLGNLRGGTLMHWMDICAALVAAKHSGRICVTASVDEINFLGPVKLGQVVHLHASLNRAFTTSMEIGVRVEVEDIHTGHHRHVNTGYMTFVAIDEIGHPVPVPEATAVTAEEKARYHAAGVRRRDRLARRNQIATEQAKIVKAASAKRKKK
jgi:acyl-CoA hydrolase